MNLGELVERMLGQQRPPPSAPRTDRTLPTAAEIRWAQMRADALIRRARDLEVDVQLEVTHRDADC